MIFRLNIFILLFTFSILAQTESEKILAKAKEVAEAIKDYSCNVEIKIDVEFLKVPDNKAKLYYKYPDKVKIETDGSFALMPKEGLNFSPGAILNQQFTSIYEKDEKVDGVNCAIIKVIPTGSESDVILSTLWIDRSNYFIRKMQTTTKTNGTFQIYLKYDTQKYKHATPVELVFSFEIAKFKLPRMMNNDKDKKKDDGKAKTEGKVFVKYSNYSINTGLKDSFFDEAKSKK